MPVIIVAVVQFEHAEALSGALGLLRFAKDPLGSLTRAREVYGTRAFYTQFAVPFGLLTDPECIEELLVGNASSLNKDRFTAQLGRVLGRGLVTSEGELWRRQRKLMAPSFQPKSVDKLAQVMVQSSNNLVGDYASGQTRDVHADMMHLTLDIVVRTLFGSSGISPEEVDEHLSKVLAGFHTLMFSWRALFPVWTPFPTRLKLGTSRTKLRHIVADIIRSKRAGSTGGDDLLSRLINATDEAGKRMDDEQLLDEALTVFLAGHETTALALTYALVNLARHPDVATRLEAEVDEVVGSGDLSPADVPRLPFCQAVLKEAMRLYPPVWAIGRWAQKPITVGGRVFAAGTQFVIPQWVVHHDVQWFPNPLSFRPERWLDGDTDALPKFAYFPFGGGPRVCIGNYFAMLEATIALATIVHNVQLRLPDGFELKFVPTITLRPSGPILMHVERREAGVRRGEPGATASRSDSSSLTLAH